MFWKLGKNEMNIHLQIWLLIYIISGIFEQFISHSSMYVSASVQQIFEEKGKKLGGGINQKTPRKIQLAQSQQPARRFDLGTFLLSGNGANQLQSKHWGKTFFCVALLNRILGYPHLPHHTLIPGYNLIRCGRKSVFRSSRSSLSVVCDKPPMITLYYREDYKKLFSHLNCFVFFLTFAFSSKNWKLLLVLLASGLQKRLNWNNIRRKKWKKKAENASV